jgi:hypothetical protein
VDVGQQPPEFGLGHLIVRQEAVSGRCSLTLRIAPI